LRRSQGASLDVWVRLRQLKWLLGNDNRLGVRRKPPQYLANSISARAGERLIAMRNHLSFQLAALSRGFWPIPGVDRLAELTDQLPNLSGNLLVVLGVKRGSK
jgi:hypothetical protein